MSPSLKRIVKWMGILTLITIIGLFLFAFAINFLYTSNWAEYQSSTSCYCPPCSCPSYESSPYSVEPPYILIKGRNVTFAFEKTDGEIEMWELPVESFESSIILGHWKRENSLHYVNLEDSRTGKIHKIVDIRDFVDPKPFKNVISELYYECNGDEEAFIFEVWNILTQLTTYSSEIKETPRYPIETLVGGGGDCEDLAILFASMIKAAPVDWKVELVYMDADNPTDPKEVNHVIVFIETDTSKYFIETTSKTEISPFEEVRGWYLEI